MQEHCLKATHTATRLAIFAQVDVPLVPWDVMEAAPPVDWEYAPAKFRLTCCDKADDGSDDVDFFHCKQAPEVFRRETLPAWPA